VLFTGTVMEEDCDGLCWKYIIEERRSVPRWSARPTALGTTRPARPMEISGIQGVLRATAPAPERGKTPSYWGRAPAWRIGKAERAAGATTNSWAGSITVSEFVSGFPPL